MPAHDAPPSKLRRALRTVATDFAWAAAIAFGAATLVEWAI